MPSKSCGNGKRNEKRAAARENKVVGKRQLERRAKKAREAATTEDYDNVGDADTHDIGGADNDDVQ